MNWPRRASARRLGARTRALLALLVAVALGCTGAALAHATLVFGTVTTEPAPPLAAEPFTIWLEMSDTAQAQVEDAIVFVDAVPAEQAMPESGTQEPQTQPPEPLVSSDQFEEVKPGLYRTDLVLPEEGTWVLVFRDQTFSQEVARASITLLVGEDAQAEQLSFIFPPTAIGPQNLLTWLIWLVGVPLVIGCVVTLVVLRGNNDASRADEDPGRHASETSNAKRA